jgi:Reverse transcriptase (RNA-dependent DNA polymerase)
MTDRIVNNRLYWWLEITNTINKHQAGFRAGQWADDQLFRLSQRISSGFQHKKHTVAVFVDLQQAYDKVWRKYLLWKLNNAWVNGKLYKLLKSFLTDRKIQNKLNNAFSSNRVLEERLPQGSSLSCTLMFTVDLQGKLQMENVLFADDLVK